ncbi:ABC transporter ATP-binding protein [Streptomyces sp. NPDC048636]|uniref:ABC transporter ATP-binding protein n=1 Tax=Streptomyces sp. NPDC048636 TaxID=3155762 RepID=UPI003442C554
MTALFGESPENQQQPSGASSRSERASGDGHERKRNERNKKQERPDKAQQLSARQLAEVFAFASALAWRADRRRLCLVAGLQLLIGTGFGTGILLAWHLLSRPETLSLGGEEWRQSLPALVGGAVLLTVLSLARDLLSLVSNAQGRLLGLQVDRFATEQVLGAALATPLSVFEEPDFHDRLQRAVFASRSQATMTISTLNLLLGAAVQTGAVAVSFAVIAWWLLPFIAIAAVPVICTARWARQAQYQVHTQVTENRRIRQYVEGLLTGRQEAKEVRAFALGPTLLDRWRKHYENEFEQQIAVNRNSTRQQVGGRVLTKLVLLVFLGVVLWLGSLDYLDSITAATAVVALVMLTQSVQIVGYIVVSSGEQLLYLNDLRAFTNAPEGQPPFSGSRASLVRQGCSTPRALCVSDVTFTYPGSREPALAGISMTLPAGRTVALVGPNGSGKTTLSKLIAGLYTPDSGHVSLDGSPAPDPSRLQEAVALVFQDFVRYKFTAEDNITFGRPTSPPDSEAAVRAAREAGAHDFISALRYGYHTYLGKEFTEGADLSGGEWQRLALARAFYRNAGCVILDEPTAALDAEAEAELFAHVRDLFADRTVVLISHRFSSIRMADYIYVLDEGMVVEEGTHTALMRREGVYARLYLAQASSFLDESAG